MKNCSRWMEQRETRCGQSLKSQLRRGQGEKMFKLRKSGWSQSFTHVSLGGAGGLSKRCKSCTLD